LDITKFKLKWLKVGGALRRLYKNPNDLEAVFIIFNWLSTRSVRKQYERFRRTPVGSRVIVNNESLVSLLDDVKRLQAMPVGSLGNEYAKFLVESGQSTEQFVGDTKNKGEKPSESGFNTYIKWYRDQHDLTHTVTGYERNPFSEVILLWFVQGNFANFGMVVMTLPMTITHARKKGWGVFGVSFEAYMNGRKAQWLSGMDWPALLSMPLEDVKTSMNIEVPVKYQDLMFRLRQSKKEKGYEQVG
jgi:ubiquinone biosynthesis protein COQ4